MDSQLLFNPSPIRLEINGEQSNDMINHDHKVIKPFHATISDHQLLRTVSNTNTQSEEVEVFVA